MTRRFGARGVVLALFGFTWIMFGFGLYEQEVERFSRVGPGGPIEFMDSNTWGMFWVAIGFYSVASMFLKKYSAKWFDELAYGVMVLPPTLWAISYLISFGSWWWSNGELGQQRSFTGFAIFGILCVIVLYLARHLRDVKVGEE